MIFIQAFLAIGLLFVSLLLFVMVRQIGVIAQRIPKKTDAGVVNSLPLGIVIPVREFDTYDHENRIVFSPGTRDGAVLLFLSFTCPVCNQLLPKLSDSPTNVRKRLVLFMLDTDIQRRFAKEIRKMRLNTFPIVEAYELAKQFRIYRAPFVYVVDGEGNVLDASAIVSNNDLVALVRKHFGTATEKEEFAYVSRSSNPQSARYPGESVGDLDVAKVQPT